VLVHGETGTGKTVLARWIHSNSRRAGEAFVDLNCAGISREFLETELFGHEKGAFTGATSTKQGLLEVANRGTVFLDEIGDMELRVQASLLKVLEEKRFRRLGDVKDRNVDIRLIAATHRELRSLVEEKRFRQDLYYRICTLELTVPALRDRRDDIPLLAKSILEGLARDLGQSGVRISAAAERILCRYDWPGNIRELRNVVERLLLLAGDEVTEADVQLALPAARAGAADKAGCGAGEQMAGPLAQRVLAFERVEVLSELERHGRHVTQTARALGLERSHLYKKCQQLGIDLQNLPARDEKCD
jgi:DNA-binding NtrC family response regulator